jgi:cell division protein FtsW
VSAALRPLAGLRARRAEADLAPEGGLAAAVAILCAMGVVMIYSVTAPLARGETLPPLFVRHVAGLALGVACALGVQRVPLRFWRRAALPLWAAALGLLLATALLGVRVNGAQRWLALPGIGLRIQPAELAKWATLLAAAALLARHSSWDAPPPARLLALGTLGVLPVGLILAQPDLGNAALLLAMLAALAFVAGIPTRVFVAPALLGALALGACIWLRPYAFDRLVGFLEPWERASQEGFQLVQSFVAFGRGGAWGVGMGDGRQKLWYLPEAHTDFILSVVAEEAGLLGVLAVLGAFAALVLAGTRIARRAQDPFAGLLAFGMTLLLAVPAVVNAAVVTGTLPTKGLALPFLSYGGSCMVCSFLAVGLLARVAREGSGARGRPAWARLRSRWR